MSTAGGSNMLCSKKILYCYVILLGVVSTLSCNLEEYFNEKQVSVEESAFGSEVIFRGYSTAEAPTFLNDIEGVFTAHFELINTYKGAKALDVWVTSSNRHVNVTLVGRFPECDSAVTVPQEYIVFCNVVEGELKATSIKKWDENVDQRVWGALGWSKWTDWSSCSVSCSAGIQQRIRHCLTNNCLGFNVEQRHCNLFGCEDVVNPLTLEEGKFFHPSKERWQRVPDRPTAWRLKPNTYIWLPSIELYPKLNGHAFPKEFTLFITLRLQNDSNMGTIFSLRSRGKLNTYLSLEVAGPDLKLVHATANGTDVVRIPSTFGDENWHQIAISFRDDSIVDTYIDCEWSRTIVLRKDEIVIPEDCDVIIGYLFSGDLDQLSIVSDPTVISLQCSPIKTPITDPSVKESPVSSKSLRGHKKFQSNHYKRIQKNVDIER